MQVNSRPLRCLLVFEGNEPGEVGSALPDQPEETLGGDVLLSG